jgi:hypothetical protein
VLVRASFQNPFKKDKQKKERKKERKKVKNLSQGSGYFPTSYISLPGLLSTAHNAAPVLSSLSPFRNILHHDVLIILLITITIIIILVKIRISIKINSAELPLLPQRCYRRHQERCRSWRGRR